MEIPLPKPVRVNEGLRIIEEPQKPYEVYKNFKWEGTFATAFAMRHQLMEFAQGEGSSLDIEPTIVMTALNQSLRLAEKWYDTVFPNREMKDHDYEHVHNTAIVGMKMLLGKLTILRETNPEMAIFKNAGMMKRYLDTAAAAFALHEVNDWWGGGQSGKRLGNGKDYATMRQELAGELSGMMIDIRDVERLTDLDDYVNDIPVTMAALEKSGIGDFMTFLPEQDRLILAQLPGESLTASDFAQVCNEAYATGITIKDDELGVPEVRTIQGVVALAREMELFRPNGLKYADWMKEGSDPPVVDWTKTLWTRKFYEEKAYKRIMHGMDGLWRFSPQEARGILIRLMQLESLFALTDWRSQNTSAESTGVEPVIPYGN